MQHPEPGDFLVTPVGGDGGKAIRFLEWIDWKVRRDKEDVRFQHAALYVGNDQIVEAERHGAVLSPWDKYKDLALWSTGILPLTDQQRTSIAAAGRGFVGTPYSIGDYVAEAIHTLRLHPLDNMLKRYIASTKHMDCSHLVDAAWSAGGAQLFDDGRWPGYVTPSELGGLLFRKAMIEPWRD